MCIRDRSVTVAAHAEVGRPAHEGHEDQHDREDDRDQQEDCLLYTSDAADERSSVDLGGRRIIKKKKRYRTVCQVS